MVVLTFLIPFTLFAVFPFIRVTVKLLIFRLSAELSKEETNSKDNNSVEDKDISHEPEIEHWSFRDTSLTFKVDYLHIYQDCYFKDKEDTDNWAIAESSL